MANQDLLLNQQIDPLTGLTVKKTQVDPAALRDRILTNLQSKSPTEAFESQIGGRYLDSKYDQGLSYFEDQAARRAAEQSWPSEVGNAIAQSVIGSVFGGSIEGLGYLYDFKQYHDLAEGTEQEFGSLFTQAGKALQEYGRENFPVYDDPAHEGQFRPWDITWMAKNLPSIASSLSLLLPAAGTLKGASMLGKMLQLTGSTGKAGKYVNAISGAMMSRHMENLMEATQNGQQAYDDMFAKTKDHNLATQAMAQVATDVYKKNWILLAQDIPQWMLLGKMFPKSTMENSLTLSKALKQPVKALLAKKSYNLGWDMLSEGGEEAYQYITGEEARHLASRLGTDETDPSSFTERMDEYLRDGEFWSSAYLGALGAGVFQAAGSLMDRQAKAQQDAARIKDIFSYSAQVAQANNAVKFAEELGDQAGMAVANLRLAALMGGKSSLLGNVQNGVTFLEELANSNLTDEDLATRGATRSTVDQVKQNFTNTANLIKEVGAKYDKYTSDGVAPELAAKLAESEFLHEKLTALLPKFEQQTQELKSQIPQLNLEVDAGGLTAAGKEILTNQLELDNSVQIVKLLTKQLKDETLNPQEKKDKQGEIEVEEKKQKALIENIKNFEELRTPEGKEFDAKASENINEIKLKEFQKSLLSLRYLSLETNAVLQEVGFWQQVYKQSKQPTKGVPGEAGDTTPEKPVQSEDQGPIIVGDETPSTFEQEDTNPYTYERILEELGGTKIANVSRLQNQAGLTAQKILNKRNVRQLLEKNKFLHTRLKFLQLQEKINKKRSDVTDIAEEEQDIQSYAETHGTVAEQEDMTMQRFIKYLNSLGPDVFFDEVSNLINEINETIKNALNYLQSETLTTDEKAAIGEILKRERAKLRLIEEKTSEFIYNEPNKLPIVLEELSDSNKEEKNAIVEAELNELFGEHFKRYEIETFGTKGSTFKINGKLYRNKLYDYPFNPLQAINRNKEGKVVSVTLTRMSDNKDVTFRDEKLVDQIAYSLILTTFEDTKNRLARVEEKVKTKPASKVVKKKTPSGETTVIVTPVPEVNPEVTKKQAETAKKEKIKETKAAIQDPVKANDLKDTEANAIPDLSNSPIKNNNRRLVLRNGVPGYILLDNEKYFFIANVESTPIALNPEKTLAQENLVAINETITKLSLEIDGIVIENEKFLFPDQLTPESALLDYNLVNLVRLANIDDLVTFTLKDNPVLHNDLAFALTVLSEAREKVFNEFKRDPEHPVIVTDPADKESKKKEYVLYNLGKVWQLEEAENSEARVGNVTRDRILKNVFKELDRKINNYYDKRLKGIEHELTGITFGIRAASPEEIDKLKSRSEVGNPKGDTTKKVRSDEKSKEKGKKSADVIANKTAERLVETEETIAKSKEEVVEVKPVLPDPKEDTTIVAPDATDIVEDQNVDPVSSSSSTKITMWYDYKEEGSMVDYVSDPDNSLVGDIIEFEIDFTNDASNWKWSQHEELKKKLQSKKGPFVYTAEMDSMPIRAYLLTKDGQRLKSWVPVPSTFGYSSLQLGKYPHIVIGKEITSLPTKAERDAAVKALLEKHNEESRILRSRIIEHHLKGEKLVSTTIYKEKGIPRQNDKVPHTKIPDTIPIPIDELVIGNANDLGQIQSPDGRNLGETTLDNLHSGSVFIGVGRTSNDLEGIVQAISQKISREHAEIIFNSFYTIATVPTGQKDTPITPEGDIDSRVSGKKSKQVLDLLILYKEDQKGRRVGLEKSVLTFGDNRSLDLAKTDVKSAEFNRFRDDFIDFVSTEVVYPFSIPHMRVSSKVKTDFKIGNLRGKAGETYRSVILNGGLYKTNIQMHYNGKTFYQTPVVSVDPHDVKVAGEIKQETDQVKVVEKVPTGQSAVKNVQDLLNKRNKRYNRTIMNPEVRRYTSEDLYKELQWLKARFPEIPVYLLDHAIKLAEKGQYAWGTVENASIRLYNKAEVGTGFHEAYHIVSIYLLNEKQRQAIYADARIKYNKPNATDTEIEEILAEEFRKYILTEQKYKPKSNRIWQWFKDLYDFIYTFFTGKARLSTLEVDSLFRAIDKKQFTYAKPLKENIKQMEGEIFASRVAGFTHEQTDTIIKNIVYDAITANNIVTAQDVSRLNLEKVVELYKADLKEYKEFKIDPRETGAAEAQSMLDHEIGILTTILTHFDKFKELTDDFLTSLNIRTRKLESEDGESREIEELGEADDGIAVPDYDKTVYEFNAADNVLANVKLFLATVPSGKIDPFTGRKKFLDFNSAWSKIMYDVWQETDIYGVMARLNELASTNEPYSILLNGVVDSETGKILRPGLQNGPETLRTQFGVALNKYKYDFISVLSSGRYKANKHTIIYTALRRDISDTSKTWARYLLESPILNQQTALLDKHVLATFNTTFKALQNAIKVEFVNNGGRLSDANIPQYIEQIRGLIGTLGIDITPQAIIALATKNKSTLDSGLKNFVTSNRYLSSWVSLLNDYDTEGKKNLVELEKKFKASIFTRELAESSVITSPENITNVVLGANNNNYYIYSGNSFMTDSVKRFNKYPRAFIDGKRTVANTNSLTLKQLEEGKSLQIATFSSYGNKAYKDLTPQEDFLMKFHFAINHLIDEKEENYLGLPTLAEKNQFHMFKGFDKVDISGLLFNPSLVFPDNVIDVFEGYVTDERLRIEKAKADIDRLQDMAPEDRDYSTMIKNYHYKELDSDGFPILKNSRGEYIGNATKYIKFPELNTQAYSRQYIINMLTARLLDTVRLAEERGIIKIHRNGKDITISNLLIDQRAINKVITDHPDFQSTPLTSITKAIYYLFADFTINGLVANVETGTLLYGDIALYANADDMMKRLASVIAPGDSLRSVYMGPAQAGEFTGGPSYRSITVKNYIHKNTNISEQFDYRDKLIENLTKTFKGTKLYAGYTDAAFNKAMTTKADEILKHYEKADPADGQVMVTPAMYRSIVNRLGEWTPEFEKAYNLMMSNKTLTLEEEATLYDLVMQPLKLVYAGLHNINGVDVMMYDKMSISCMFPRLMSFGKIGNTDLLPLYNYMIENNIDMVKYDSAVKVGGRMPLDYFDENGKPKLANIAKGAPVIVTEQQFQYLKRQQVTTPHEKASLRLAAPFKKLLHRETDVMKKILASLSNRGKQNIKKKFLQDDGKIDFVKLYEILAKASKQANFSSDIIDALKAIDANTPGQYIDAMVEREWIQSRLISMVLTDNIFNEVRGDQYVQHTSLALNRPRVRVDEKLKLLDDKGRTELIVSINLYKDKIPKDIWALGYEESRKWLLRNKEILEGVAYRVPMQGPNMLVPFVIVDVLPSYTGNTVYVPYDFTILTDSDFDIDKLFLFTNSYRRLGNDRLERIDFIEGDDAQDRVTNEDKLRQLYKDNYGGRLRLRDKLRSVKEEVDKDQLFLSKFADLFKEEDELKNILYDEIKNISVVLSNYSLTNIKASEFYKVLNELENLITEEQYIKENKNSSAYDLNSKAALENKMLELYQQELTDPDYIYENRIPLRYVNEILKDTAKKIVEAEGGKPELTGLEYASPNYQLRMRDRFLSSKSGVAPFVLAISHHALTVGVGNFKLKFDIGIDELMDEYGRIDFSKVLGRDYESIFAWLSGLVSANVDALKDPYIFDLNVNRATWNIASFLIRAGLGLDALYFLTQPVLKDLVKNPNPKLRMRQTKLKYKEAFNQAVHNANLTKFISLHTAVKNIPDQDIFDGKILLNHIKTPIVERDYKWYAFQYKVLDMAHQVSKVSWEITNNSNAARIDNRKNLGNSFSSLRLAEIMINRSLDSRLLSGHKEIFTDTFLADYQRNSIDFIRDTFSKVTIESSLLFTDLFNELVYETKAVSKAADLKIDIVKSINKGLYSTVIGDYFVNPMGFGLKAKNILNLLSGENSVANKIRKLQISTNPEFEDFRSNFLISNLTPFIHPEGKYHFLQIPLRPKTDRYFINNCKDAWADLFANPKYVKLAKEMLQYAFYTSGFGFTRHSIARYIPNKAFAHVWGVGTEGAVSFNTFIKEQLGELNDVHLVEERKQRIKREFYLNNWDDDNLVPEVTVGNGVPASDPEMNKKVLRRGYSLIFKLSYEFAEHIGTNKDGTSLYRPFVKYYSNDNREVFLAEFVGTEYTYDDEGEIVQVPVYRTIEKKGLKDSSSSHIIKEYTGTDTFILENNLPKVVTEEAIKTDLIRVKGYTRFEYVEPNMRNMNVMSTNVTTTDINDEPVVDNSQTVIPPIPTPEEVVTSEVGMPGENIPSEYKGHSGGAYRDNKTKDRKSSDTVWEDIGKEYGVEVIAHSFEGHVHGGKKTIVHTEAQLLDADKHVQKANVTLNRYAKFPTSNNYVNNLMRRNWYQIVDSDAIYAVGQFINEMNLTVDGGTGWAVQMAQDNRKTVYFFDQRSNKWYTSENGSNFSETSTPTLTKNFAGIGTREITEEGIQAIRDVYNKTFWESGKAQKINPIETNFHKYFRDTYYNSFVIDSIEYFVDKGRYYRKDLDHEISFKKYQEAWEEFYNDNSSEAAHQMYTDLYNAREAGSITKETFLAFVEGAFGKAEETLERVQTKVTRFMSFLPYDYIIVPDIKSLTKEQLNNKNLIKVVYNDSIPLRGRWDLYNRVLHLNPLLIQKDTFGHEMFHILYDLMGGMQNKLIQQAIKQLANSPVHETIKKIYPKYIPNSEDYNAELLAWAVDQPVEELFTEDEQRQGFWQWLMRFFTQVKARLGLTRNKVRRLAEIVALSTTKIDKQLPTGLIEQSAQQKVSVKDELLKSLDDVNKLEQTWEDKLIDKARYVIEKKLQIYGYTKKDPETLEKLEAILHRIDTAKTKRQKIVALYRFVEKAVNDSEDILKRYHNLLEKEAAGDPNAFNPRILKQLKEYVVGYSIVEDIRNMLMEEKQRPQLSTKPEQKEAGVHPYLHDRYITVNATVTDKDGKEKKEKKKVVVKGWISQLNDVLGIRQDMENIYKEKGLKLMARFLAPYSTQVKIAAKEKYEMEYKQLPTEKKREMTQDQYINQRLELNKKQIEEATATKIEMELRLASRDINVLERWIDTAYDSNDMVASALVKAFDTANFNAEVERKDLLIEMVGLMRELEQDSLSKFGVLTDVRKVYDYMAEKNSKGEYTGQIVREIKSGFWDVYHEALNKVKAKAEEDGLTPAKRQEVIDDATQEFFAKNAPRSKKKWKQYIYDLDKFIDSLREQGKITDENLRWLKGQIMEREHKQSADYYMGLTIEITKIKDYWRYVDQDVAADIKQWNNDNWTKYSDVKPQWINPQYAEIMSLSDSDPRKKFYNFVLNKLVEVEKELPYAHRLFNRFPGVRKVTGERLVEGQGPMKLIKGKYERTVKVTGEDTERAQFKLTDEAGNPVHYLPIYFTEKLPIEDQSFDLGSIYYQYFSMGIDFKHTSKILPELEMARFFINDRQVMERDSNGNPIMEKLKKSSSKIKELAIKKAGTNSLLAAQINDWFEAAIYGLNKKDEGFIPGTKIDFAKTVDAFNSYTALNMLGLNFIQGTANVFLGEVNQIVEAVGGEFFNMKDYAYANAYYGKQLPLLVGDIGSRIPENIVNILNDRFDTLNDFGNERLGSNTKFKQLMRLDTAFFTTHAGEHLMQSTAMLAMLHSLRAKNSEQKDIGSMLQYLKAHNGQLEVAKEVANFGMAEQALFRQQLKRVLSSMHGEYSRHAHVAIQRLALGRMAFMFRKFVVPGFKRRWGSLSVNEFKGTFTEGYYRTTGRFIYSLLKSLSTLRFMVFSENWDKLLDREKANIRRMIAEMAFLVAAIILARVVVKIDDEDDEESALLNHLAYQLLRFKAELFFFTPKIDEAMKILRSPAAAVTMLETMIDFFSKVSDPIFNLTFEWERYEKGPRKGEFKFMKPAINLIPMYKQYFRIKHIEDMLGWFK